MARGERLAGRDRPGEPIIVAVGAHVVAGVRRPVERRPELGGGEHTTAVSRPEHIIELIRRYPSPASAAARLASASNSTKGT